MQNDKTEYMEKGMIVKIIPEVSVQGCIGTTICPNEDWIVPAWTVFITDAELEKKVGKEWIGFNVWTIPTKGLEVIK